MQTFGRRARIFCAAALIAALGVFGAGCASTTSPKLFDRLEIGKEPHAYKRLDRKGELGFMQHFSRTVYHGATSGDLKKLAPDQKNVVDYWGKPTWVRKPFESLDNERVIEWIYLDGQQLFQFVDGNVVFEGPITDYEQILLKRGYPNACLIDRKSNDNTMITMTYQDIFKIDMEVYAFHNGVLTQAREGN